MGNAESTTAIASVYGTATRAISGFRKLLRLKAPYRSQSQSMAFINSMPYLAGVMRQETVVSPEPEVRGLSLGLANFKLGVLRESN